MSSSRFAELQARVKDLRRLLLPAKFDPTGSYRDPTRVSTRALSFRVLAHAELEAYFEDRVLEVSLAALQAWQSARHVSEVTMHLIGFAGRTLELPPDSLISVDAKRAKEWTSKTTIEDRFSRCVSDFQKRVRVENHGIKEANLLQLLIPIGFDISKCDAVFLGSMNAFGEARGLVAHTSGRAHVRKGVDPKDEYEKLRAIILSIAPIDDELTRLLNMAGASQSVAL